MRDLLLVLIVFFGFILIAAGIFRIASDRSDCGFDDCDAQDIVAAEGLVANVLMIFGGMNVLALYFIQDDARMTRALLKDQIEQAEKTNRALAAIYKQNSPNQ